MNTFNILVSIIIAIMLVIMFKILYNPPCIMVCSKHVDRNNIKSKLI